MSTVSVAELKSAINAAIEQIRGGQAAIAAATVNLESAQGQLHVVCNGTGHESIMSAQAALSQAASELEQSLAATNAATEQAESYAASL